MANKDGLDLCCLRIEGLCQVGCTSMVRMEHQTLDEMACLYITYHHLMVGSIGNESTASPGQGSNAAVAASTNMLLPDLHRHQSFGLGIALTRDQQAGVNSLSKLLHMPTLKWLLEQGQSKEALGLPGC